MNDQTDQQLLRDYAERQSEAAFAAIVQRYVDLVYSAAFRMVCDAHAAKDVTQAVFVVLAQNARQLTDRPALAGWLHGTSRNLAAKTIRSDVRRRAREQEAAVMNELLSAHPDTNWEHIAPYLDDALGELDDADRDAVLLRYFKNHDLRTVGATLGISDDAAQKRVSRAVERLRDFFAKRGVTVGASGLAVVISANAVQAAPMGLALTISTAAALTGTTLATAATLTATKAIAMTALQKTIVAATIAVLAGAGIYEARQASQLRDQVQTLQQKQAPLTDQDQQLQKEREESARQLAALREDDERLNRNTAELLKLRGEVARMRSDSQELAALKSGQSNDPVFSEAVAWRERVNSLKQHFEQNPGKRIPEMQFLGELNWLEAAKIPEVVGAPLLKAGERYDELGGMVGTIKEFAKDEFAKKMSHALRNFLDVNAGELPTHLTQLKPHFLVPVGDDVLERYELLYSGNVKDISKYARNCALISEKKAIADTSTQTMIRIGEVTFSNLSSY